MHLKKEKKKKRFPGILLVFLSFWKLEELVLSLAANVSSLGV